jgi:hypothetical protein
MLYALLAVNAFFVGAGLVYRHPIVYDLGYAFAPLLAAVLAAWFLTTAPTTRKAFRTNVEITWCLALFCTGFSLMSSLGL